MSKPLDDDRPQKVASYIIQEPLRSPAPFRLMHLASASRRSGSLYHLSVTDQRSQCELRLGDI